MATKKNSKQLIQKTLDEVKTVVVYVRVSTEEQANRELFFHQPPKAAWENSRSGDKALWHIPPLK